MSGVVPELFSQVSDSSMDGIVADNPILPEMIDQLLARNHSIGMLGQVPENAHGQRLHRRSNAVPAYRVRSKID
jgi:hypothetical protein